MGALALSACRSSTNPPVDFAVTDDLAHPDLSVQHDAGGDAGHEDLKPVDLKGVDGLIDGGLLPLFGAAKSYPVENGPIYLTTTDLNADNKQDLIVVNVNDPAGMNGAVVHSTVNVLLGNGDGTFQTKVSSQITDGPFSVSTSDLNGDGHPDVVITDSDGFDLMLGSATGTLAAPVHTMVGTSGYCRFNAVGDIDGDAKLDVVIADQGDNVSQGLVWVVPGKGDGTFGTPVSFPVSTATDGNIRWTNVVRLGLMDNDTKLDVVTANVNTNTVSILINTSTVGAPTLGAPTELATAQVPQDLLVGQLDAVNKTDMVVVDQVGNAIDVYLSQDNTAALSYSKAAVYPAGPGPVAATFGDFDGDTHSDIAVANAQQGLVTVIYGAAGGIFNTPAPDHPGSETYPVGTDPISIVSASFNSTKDTKPDVATANQVSNDVSILVNER